MKLTSTVKGISPEANIPSLLLSFKVFDFMKENFKNENTKGSSSLK